MSQMTRIKITHEQGFASKECLEEALEMHDLGSSFQIIREGDKYQLNASSSRRDGNKFQMEESLKQKLDKVVDTILPTYTRLLATEDFNSKGFYLKEEKTDVKEEILIFEKITSIDESVIPEQIVLRIRGKYGLSINTKNFAGKECLDATKSFEDKIGSVTHRVMKLEEATNNRRLLEIPICR